MRISLITEASSEYASLPRLSGQLHARTGNTFLKPLKVNVPPDAVPAVIARECKSRVLIARSTQHSDLIILLLDREQQSACPGALASAIEAELSRACGGGEDIRVVLKDRMYENWLLADLEALRVQPARFSVSAPLVRAIEPNKADKANAIKLIKLAVRGDYDKVPDSIRIMQHMNLDSAAIHSRSIRHFLHVSGDRAYATQCKRP